jgi:hypothetical protein
MQLRYTFFVGGYSRVSQSIRFHCLPAPLPKKNHEPLL